MGKVGECKFARTSIFLSVLVIADQDWFSLGDQNYQIREEHVWVGSYIHEVSHFSCFSDLGSGANDER